jgi:hypothetical protein
MPAPVAFGRLGFAMRVFRTPPSCALNSSRVIAIVGGHDAGQVLARRQPDRVEVARGGFEGRRKRRRVTFVGRMDQRGHDDAGVHSFSLARLLFMGRGFPGWRP